MLASHGRNRWQGSHGANESDIVTWTRVPATELWGPRPRPECEFVLNENEEVNGRAYWRDEDIQVSVVACPHLQTKPEKGPGSLSAILHCNSPILFVAKMQITSLGQIWYMDITRSLLFLRRGGTLSAGHLLRPD